MGESQFEKQAVLAASLETAAAGREGLRQAAVPRDADRIQFAQEMIRAMGRTAAN